MILTFDQHDALHCQSDDICLRCLKTETDWTYSRCRSCSGELVSWDHYDRLVKSGRVLIMSETGLMRMNSVISKKVGQSPHM